MTSNLEKARRTFDDANCLNGFNAQMRVIPPICEICIAKCLKNDAYFPEAKFALTISRNKNCENFCPDLWRGCALALNMDARGMPEICMASCK